MISTSLRFFVSPVFVLVLFSSWASGQLLVSDRATNQVNRYSTSGEFQGILIGGDPATNGGLVGPSAMTIGHGGELLVASQFTGSVLRYDVDTGSFLGVFAEQVNGPAGLLYDQDSDELLVSTLGNFDSELVLRFPAPPAEAPLTSMDAIGVIGEGTGMSGRTGLGFGPDGNLYVSSFANGEFFTGAMLQFDGETFAPSGIFALEPFLSGASNFTFRPGDEDGTFQLDLVGLFSNNVARFHVADDGGSLSVQDQAVLISPESGLLDFPSAIQDLGDGSMLVTNLGNDNPQMGELRPGSIERFDIATGDSLGTFIAAGGEAQLAQPTALLLLSSGDALDCNGDGIVNADDLTCICALGSEQRADLLGQLQLVEGDLDASGEVDFADFLTLSGAFGNAGDYTDGDLDCNGTVDFADFLILSGNFGQQSPAGQAAVPEPATAALLTIAAVGLMLTRRRRTPY